MALNKEDILAADDLPKEVVPVPEWGGEVIVRSMNGIERDHFEEMIYIVNGKSTTLNKKNIRAKLCAMTIVGDDDVLLFNESDFDALGKKSAKVLDRIFAVAQELNGLSDKDVEDLAKNLMPDLSDNSTSDCA